MDFHDIAVDFILAVMRSASTDKIRPIDWWQRAKTALESSAGGAAHWDDLLTRIARKLQIEVYREASVLSLEGIRDDLEDFRPFATYCRRHSIAIVAAAQAQSAAARDERKAAKAQEEVF